jgi:asparagine synthase (glutamine-hydrolysing)
MCGIAGVFGISARNAVIKSELVERMCNAMRARGPDAVGYWHNDETNISLGHRRLSIIDLDERANQPMLSDNKRYVIVFNGEIYNFRDLRKQLESEGESFRTEGDTEVLLKLFIRDGEKMLPKLRGMFALAIWDQQTRSLFLARDPYGIKPLYVGRSGDGWCFASQAKALLASGLVSHEPDVIGRAGYWLTGSVPSPHSFYRDISVLPAGSWCRLSPDTPSFNATSYWDIGDSWRNAPVCTLPENEIREIVCEALLSSVKNHLVADVAVGIFLSGGIDSGSLAGLMKDTGARDTQGITIAFSEFSGKPQDEAPMANLLATHYGIKHHVRVVTRREFEQDLPKIIAAMDCPSIDGINTWYASKAVAELGLKVVLSGVGGDELFCGYPSFQQVPKLQSRWRKIKAIPGLSNLVDVAFNAKALQSDNSRWRWMARQADNLYGAYWLRRGLFTPDQLPGLMQETDAHAVLQELSPGTLIEMMCGPLANDSLLAVGQMESMCYMRNQLLRDSDWASMDHSVELRTPLVDAWLLRDLMPVIQAFSRFPNKNLLSQSPHIPLPLALMQRKKTGFTTPVEQWLTQLMPEMRIDGGSRGWARQVNARFLQGMA